MEAHGDFYNATTARMKGTSLKAFDRRFRGDARGMDEFPRRAPKHVTLGRIRAIVPLADPTLTTNLLDFEMPRQQNEFLASLEEARDRSAFSSRSTSKGALIAETHAVFSAVRQGLPASEVRLAIAEGRILRKTASETRRKIADAISHRYLWPHRGWCVRSLAAATDDGTLSPGFLSLAYLYYALRDRLVFEFVTETLWQKWRNHSTHVSSPDVLRYLEQKAVEEEQIRKWRESTRIKIASNTLTALREFGLLHGIYRKQLQKPSVAPETTFHLLCILLAEGADGRCIVEAPDWRLFLWSETEVTHALGALAQKRWIRFESSGRTVMLELLRQPGEAA